MGTAPGFLYAMLPYAVDYTPHTTYHLMETLQLLGFAALAFVLFQEIRRAGRPHLSRP